MLKADFKDKEGDVFVIQSLLRYDMTPDHMAYYLRGYFMHTYIGLAVYLCRCDIIVLAISINFTVMKKTCTVLRRREMSQPN